MSLWRDVMSNFKICCKNRLNTYWGISCGIEKHLAKKNRKKQQISNKKLGATNSQILKNRPKSKEISTNQAPKQVRRPLLPGFPNFLALLKPSSSTHLVGHPSHWTLLASAMGLWDWSSISGIYGIYGTFRYLFPSLICSSLDLWFKLGYILYNGIIGDKHMTNSNDIMVI